MFSTVLLVCFHARSRTFSVELTYSDKARRHRRSKAHFPIIRSRREKKSKNIYIGSGGPILSLHLVLLSNT